jgi:hypothetical protein
VHEQITPLDLLHLLEVQRRTKFSLGEGYPERHWVGGLALLTTVTKDGVSQRVMHRWDEDRLGEIIEPLPVADWKSWRATKAKAAMPDGMSRLKRDMLAKKIAKRKAA